jgi:hypothetical protein
MNPPQLCSVQQLRRCCQHTGSWPPYKAEPAPTLPFLQPSSSSGTQGPALSRTQPSGAGRSLDELRAELAEAGQEHLLEGWEDLEADQQDALKAQLEVGLGMPGLLGKTPCHPSTLWRSCQVNNRTAAALSQAIDYKYLTHIFTSSTAAPQNGAVHPAEPVEGVVTLKASCRERVVWCSAECQQHLNRELRHATTSGDRLSC